MRAQPEEEDEIARRDWWLARLRTALGREFLVMPRFNCANSAELAAALGMSVKVQGGDAHAVHSWFERHERVNDRLCGFGRVLRDAETLGTGDRLRLSVAQLPFAACERWVALPAQTDHTESAGSRPGSGRLSLVVQTSKRLNLFQPVAGLLIDEWVESAQ